MSRPEARRRLASGPSNGPHRQAVDRSAAPLERVRPGRVEHAGVRRRVSAHRERRVTAPFNPSSVFVHVTKDARRTARSAASTSTSAARSTRRSTWRAATASRSSGSTCRPPADAVQRQHAARRPSTSRSGPLTVTFNERITHRAGQVLPARSPRPSCSRAARTRSCRATTT